MPLHFCGKALSGPVLVVEEEQVVVEPEMDERKEDVKKNAEEKVEEVPEPSATRRIFYLLSTIPNNIPYP